MTTGAYALGSVIDIMPVIAPKDLSSGATTGLRVPMVNAEVCTFVIFCGAGTDGDDLSIDVQEHSASTGGTSQDLDVVTKYYSRGAAGEATLDNDETWTSNTQSAASEIAAIAGSAEVQNLLVVEVQASALSAGFAWLSVNIPDLGSAGSKYGCALAILSGLRRQRSPELLTSPL